MDPYVKSTLHENGVLEIEFFHPSHNSLPSNLLKELAETISVNGEEEEVSIIVLKSGGDRTFCAGASFDELVQINDIEVGTQFFMGFAHVINACRKSSKLIVGRVQGKAVGGGVGLAAATDYCLASKFASVKLSELHVGIGPFVVGPVVERKIGLSAMSQMTINANTFYSAEWAKDKGLYAEVYDSEVLLDTAVNEMADYLTNTSPDARASLKKVFWEDCDGWDTLLTQRAAISGQLVLSEFTKEALEKYN